MSHSIKRNFSYNLILTFCNYLFPLITYPYVSRILGVSNIGTCNFVDSIINYFILFSILGIGSYGVREIAKCKDNTEKRSQIFTNLILLNAIGTLIAIIVYIIAILNIPSLQEYRRFLWVGLIKILFNMFLIEWFFQGLQQFRYIAIRSVLVRFIYVISIFIFVKNENDTIWYYGLTVAVIVINAIINLNHSRKFQHFSLKKINLKPYIIPTVSFGYYRILTSMYTTFNLVFLGFVTNNYEVGLFSTATKLYTIIMGVFTAFTTVMIPKVSELLGKGEINQLQSIANKTFSLLFSIASPIIIFSLFCAEDIIFIIAGPGYEEACAPFKIVIFLLLVIGMEQIVIQQFLMASKSNSSIFIVSSVGAIIGIVANITITPNWGAVGSALSWGCAEIGVLIVGITLMYKHVHIYIKSKTLVASVLWSFLYIPPLLALKTSNLVQYQSFVFSIVTTIILFCIINFKINKNEFLVSNACRIFNKIRRKQH